ncbi:MAG: hypothetical protein AAF266_09870 [Planctomycetota bacterium]
MSTPPTDPTEDELEAHQLLVESSLPLIFESYDDATSDDIAEPMIVLVDCEDELGGQVARGWLGDEVVDDAIAAEVPDEVSDSEQTTVFARAIAWDEAREEIAEAFPYLADAFADGPPADGVLVVGITAGGASAFTAPWDARP